MKLNMSENQRQIPLSDLEKILATLRHRINSNIGRGHPRMNAGAIEAIDVIADSVESTFAVTLTIGRESEIKNPSKPSETTRQTPNQ